MKNVAATRICAHCQQPFTPPSNRSLRCEACRTFTCDQCHRVFTSDRYNRRRVRFCSVDCTNAWQATAAAQEQARQTTISTNGRGHIQQCETCHESFYVPGWRTDRNVKVYYCSHICRNYSIDAKRNPKERIL